MLLFAAIHDPNLKMDIPELTPEAVEAPSKDALTVVNPSRGIPGTKLHKQGPKLQVYE